MSVSWLYILQTKFYPIPVVIENITASAHTTYYAHITLSYPTVWTYSTIMYQAWFSPDKKT